MARQKVGLALVLAALLVPMSLRFAPASAQDDDDPASKRVSVELDNQSLLDSLKLLFKSVGANYVIDPTVMKGAANVRVTLSIADQPFVQALESVLNAGSAKGTGLHYRLENGIYTITSKDAPGGANIPVGGGAGPAARPIRVPQGAAKSRVTLALTDKSLDESLRLLFDSANIQYVVPLHTPATGSVTMSMTNMPFEGALLGTLKAVDLGQPLGWQEMGGGIYAIVPLPGGRGVNPESVRLSMNFHQASLRDAINALFKAAGANYTIDRGIQAVPVTLKLNDVTLKASSEMLLRSSGKSNYAVVNEGGVYRVAVKSK